ncbi:MAG: response regulator [Proteobacteria bacterium]|nr:response regulator [Pseudomonadota bacterium]
MPGQTICIVDDDESVRESLGELLDATGYIVQSFASAKQFLAGNAPSTCSCLVTDVRMPDMDGIALQEELARRKTSFPVIVMTGHADVPLAVRVMRAGATDFIEKPFKPETLLTSVRQALALGAGLQISTNPEITEHLGSLTAREREVMDLMVHGHPNKVIAQKLDISFRTVEVHRSRILAKMGAENVAELVRMILSGPQHRV